MTREAQEQAQVHTRLEETSRRLHHLIGLRASLAPFRGTLQALGEDVQAPEGRRQLLALWRPCQERLDLLLDTLPGDSGWAVRMGLLRREMEDHLLDEAYCEPALADLSDTLDHACEVLLQVVDQDLRKAVALLEPTSAQEQEGPR